MGDLAIKALSWDSGDLASVLDSVTDSLSDPRQLPSSLCLSLPSAKWG